MAIDWGKAEEAAGGNFARMAEPGTYKVTVADLNVRESKNAQGATTYWLEMEFEENDGIRYPKLSHAISRKNLNWTAYHFMTMLKEFGISEEKAKQAIENCESKKSEKDIIATYLSTFDRAIAKNPEVEIEVFEDDKINPNSGRPYMRADFKNPKLAFGRGGNTKKAETVSAESIVEDGEQIDLSEIPF